MVHGFSTSNCPVLSLAEYVRRTRMEKNLSLSSVSAKSRGQIGKTHINRIENGIVSRVSLTKLRALALGLSVPVEEILAVAQGNLPSVGTCTNETTLLKYFRQLSVDRQNDLLIMVRALAERIDDQKPG
jgi:transcriptional regulator with XRE-family HTH domain